MASGAARVPGEYWPRVNGSSLGSQDPISIAMVSSSGTQLDSTSAIDSNGDFSNTWLASGRRF
jgi:hypothetical protein